MKKIIQHTMLAAALALGVGTAKSQTANFTNTLGGDWNVAANWDLDFTGVNVVPAEATNATINAVGAVTVDYTAPMAATSFGSLALDGGAILNINAAGFNQDLAGVATAPITIGGSTMNVNVGGVARSTNGGPITINTGGILNVGGTMELAPVPATAALTIAAGGALNVNSGGALVSASGNVSATGAGLRLFVNGGLMAVTNGNLSFNTAGGGSVAPGGSLLIQGQLNLGGSGGGNTGFFTNNQGTLSATTTRINPNNNANNSVLIINGGTSDLGDVTIWRSAAGSAAYQALGTEGLVISNGLVRMTSLAVGSIGANSALSCIVLNGTVTNTGSFTIQQNNNRGSRFHQLGGLVVSTSPSGIRVGVSNSTQLVHLNVLGGTNIAEQIVLGDGSNSVTGLTVGFTNNAKVYLGSGGIFSNNVNTLNAALNASGVLGARANWAGGVSLILNGGSFDCADFDGTPHNIAWNNILRGTGALNKNGGGTMTLNAANTYSGNTLINAGTLALGAAGSIASSPQIILASGTFFDVSAVAGYTLAASRTLAGLGTVSGNVAVASGGIINPGNAAGTLTFANSLTETGGAINHFDLPTTPGPGNDLLVVNGDLNVSGVNTLEIVGGGAAGTVHTLIQYGGSFNGALANFQLSGVSGTLSNNATTKTISLIVSASIRNATNVVWVGNASVNDWDTVNRTNWVNTGTGLLDYFVTGDNALFDNTGTANPIVNLVGNNAPATVTFGGTANYTLGGSGAISGTGSLTKTNTGTLTITNVNSYSGVTLLGGGVIEAATLANGGSPSSLGAALADPTKLVFDGGTLRYLGASVSTDRPATLNAGGATVDVASSGAVLTFAGTLASSGALTKAGPGQLVLSPSSTYAGGTVINGGTLQVNNNTAAGTGGITNNASTLRIQGALVLDNLVNFEGTCGLEFNGVGGNNTALRNTWVGGGTVNVYFLTANASQTFTIGGTGNMWDFSGTVDFGTNTGFLRINNENSTVNFGSSNATFNIGTGNAALNQRNGGTITHLGALIGGPNTKLVGRGNTGASGITTYSIGGKNLSTVFEGSITNGANGATASATAITKVGTGKLTLTGISPHTGDTIVQEGILQVDGQFIAGPVANVASTVTVGGGTLSGNGIIEGAVVVNAGAYLSPGASVGRLTVGTLTISSGATNIMEIHKAAGTNDSIAAINSLNYGGALVVNNLGGTLADGDVFKLFDAPVGTYGGLFESIELPVLAGPLLFWDTTQLAVDGTIRVYTPKPTITAFGVDGNNLYLTGDNGGNTSTHYIVVTSTNVTTPANLWTPVVTNTFAIDGTFGFTNAVNPATPAQFFRVKTP